MQQRILWEGDTAYGHYQVVDTMYDGRPARVLYSGERQAAQSGVATDGKSDLLFDYNQRMFELATEIKPASLLLVGGGVGTLAKALLETLPAIRIDIVEPDAALSDLAYRFFDLPVDERLRIFNTDGRSFLREHAERYDMLVVDAFTHTTIPRDMQTLEAFTAYVKHLRDPGVYAMNVISGYYSQSAQTLRQIYAAALQAFNSVDIFLASRGYTLWLPQNFVLVGQKGAERPVQDYIQNETITPPEVHPDAVLRD